MKASSTDNEKEGSSASSLQAPSSPSSPIVDNTTLVGVVAETNAQQQQQQDEEDQPSNARTFMEPSFLTSLRALRQRQLLLSTDDDSDNDDDDDNDGNQVPLLVAGATTGASPSPLHSDMMQNASPILRWCHRQMARYHWVFLVALVGLFWPLGLHSFAIFHAQTDSSFTPTAGSPSAAAQDAFAAADYGNENDWNDPMHPPLILVLQSTNNNNNDKNLNQSLVDPASPAYPWAEHYARLLAPTLNQYCWTDTGGRSPIANCTQSNQPPWIKVTSYYSLQAAGLPRLAQALQAAQGTMSMLQVQYTLPANFTGDIKRRIFDLQDAIDEYSALQLSQQQEQAGDAAAAKNATSFFTVHYTGIHYFQRDLIAATRADIVRMDTYALPTALVLMGLVLPAAVAMVVWIVPLVTMITTCCTWSVVMRIVVQYMQITQFTPTVMMSLSLGMGVDYSLFLLARYLQTMSSSSSSSSAEESTLLAHRSAAIVQMWTTAGHVVVISGTTLLCTFLGLCALPLPMLQSVGVGAAVSIAAAMVSNLLVVPALLYTPVGRWIVKSSKTTTSTSLLRNDQEQEEMIGSAAEETTITESMQPSPPPQHQAIQAMQRPKTCSIWYRLAKQLLHPYKGVVIFLLVTACLVPGAWHAPQLETSIAFDLLLPADSPSMVTYRQLGQELGPGRLHPYRILFDASDSNIRMTSVEGFAIMNEVVTALRQIDDQNATAVTDQNTRIATAETVENEVARLSLGVDRASDIGQESSATAAPTTKYSGISVLDNNFISHRTYVAAKICGQATRSCPLEILRLIDMIDKTVTTRDQKATYVTATLHVNPFADPGVHWLRAARERITHLSQSGSLQGVRIYIQGVPSIEQDAVDSVHKAFPSMIVLTIAVVFALTGIFFGSVLTPCRSIAGTVLTVGFSFGLAVLVYQEGIFNCFHVESLTSLDDSFCWLVPIMAFSIIVGLALDYDAFLMSRILEFRLEGLDHKASIAAGLHATGGIITAAGAIMAVAFGSLMFSSSPVLYQWSFILTTAVLLDTFVIRTVVVPVITNLAGERFWWPRTLPEAIYRLTTPSRTLSEEDVQNRLNELAESSEYEPLTQVRESVTDD